MVGYIEHVLPCSPVRTRGPRAGDGAGDGPDNVNSASEPISQSSYESFVSSESPTDISLNESDDEDYLRFLESPEFAYMQSRLKSPRFFREKLKEIDKLSRQAEDAFEKFEDGLYALAGNKYATRYPGFLNSAKKDMDELADMRKSVEKSLRRTKKLQEEYVMTRLALYHQVNDPEHQQLEDYLQWLRDCEGHPAFQQYMSLVREARLDELEILGDRLAMFEGASGLLMQFGTDNTLRIEIHELLNDDPDSTLVLELARNGHNYSVVSLYPPEIADEVEDLLDCFNLNVDLAFFLVCLREVGQDAFATITEDNSQQNNDVESSDSMGSLGSDGAGGRY